MFFWTAKCGQGLNKTAFYKTTSLNVGETQIYIKDKIHLNVSSRKKILSHSSLYIPVIFILLGLEILAFTFFFFWPDFCNCTLLGA